MSYNYYQSNLPGWGTNQFQFGPPPMPSYQPQPTWTGLDYYNAHGMNNDPSLYHYAMNRLGSGAMGMGLHEARHFHRRAYGGLGEVTRMMPNEIGSAAAYEAFRQFRYNSSAYSYVLDDYERQREALAGLAVAEVARLWQDTGRGHDQYGLQVASEAAAATAHMLVSQGELEGLGGGGGGSYYRGRRGSFGGSSYGGSVFDDGDSLYSRRALTPGPGMGMPISVAPSPMTPYPASLPGSTPYLGGGGGMYTPLPSMGGALTPYGGGYAGTMQGTYMPGYGTVYGHNPYGGGVYGAGTYGSYPGGQYGGQPSTIVIERPSKHHHRHGRHHHHHKRHRSLSRYGGYY
ncbi:hypothetical protein FA95DRAFT_1681271 [Auriscalpium vulgare]|uniref:Uncharacterized protein n=1 Tax=Auriscalpium vulgare TaxID=40419 RepID=A0ACB8RJI4_9AGAM|nr:hypothetical protein FA95DRAFT_1681271 [Auriscalpium vulgare]